MANPTTSYTVFGQEIVLNESVVRRMLIKSKDPDKVTSEEISSFIALCKFNELNPFLREAYLTSYTSKSTGVTNTQMIISKEAYLKRADIFPEYEGFEAGIIVLTEEGKEEKRIGTYHADNEKLQGGWAIAYRHGRKPVEARLAFREYTTGKSLWAEKPATMIRKVALVQALREQFPAQLSAMYTKEEANIEDADYTEIKDETKQLQKQQIALPMEEQQTQIPEPIPAQTAQPQIQQAAAAPY